MRGSYVVMSIPLLNLTYPKQITDNWVGSVTKSAKSNREVCMKKNYWFVYLLWNLYEIKKGKSRKKQMNENINK